MNVAASVVNTSHVTSYEGTTVETVKVNVEVAPGAIVPLVSQLGDVAADLFASEAMVVPARGRALVGTGIKLELPEGYRARLHSRSGLSLKNGIETGAGLIDNKYRDEIRVVLYNYTDVDYEVQVGDRISQICIEKYETPEFVLVESVAHAGRSAGFGSSGR
jgi:dUTP pyrophosphatase